MLTAAFLIAGVFSFLVAAIVAVWRLVIQGRSVGDLPAWEPLLGIMNAFLAMIFFSLGIYRSIQGPSGGGAGEPTPLAQATAGPTGLHGPTVILVPFVQTPQVAATPPATPSGPAAPTATAVLPAVEITMPRDAMTVSLTGLVEGTSQGLAPGQLPESAAPWVYLLVRRTDTPTAPDWWVQAYPVVEPDGSWDSFLGEGLSDMKSGTPFDICAIVTDERLPAGQRSEPPRAFSRDCVLVEAA